MVSTCGDLDCEWEREHLEREVEVQEGEIRELQDRVDDLEAMSSGVCDLLCPNDIHVTVECWDRVCLLCGCQLMDVAAIVINNFVMGPMVCREGGGDGEAKPKSNLG